MPILLWALLRWHPTGGRLIWPCGGWRQAPFRTFTSGWDPCRPLPSLCVGWVGSFVAHLPYSRHTVLPRVVSLPLSVLFCSPSFYSLHLPFHWWPAYGCACLFRPHILCVALCPSPLVPFHTSHTWCPGSCPVLPVPFEVPSQALCFVCSFLKPRMLAALVSHCRCFLSVPSVPTCYGMLYLA